MNLKIQSQWFSSWAFVLVLGWVLLFANATVSAEDAIGTDNVVILLDDSGSMGDPLVVGQIKMVVAKSALKEVLKTIPASTNVGLMSLHRDWLYPLGARKDAQLSQAIDALQPNGNTPLGGYIKKAADRLLEQREKQHGYGTYRLLIVTDGEATDGNLTQLYAPEVMTRGITLDVIGVGMSGQHTLATRSHSYRTANDPAALKKAIADVMGEVGSTGTDMAGDEAFALIAPLPNEFAQGAIQALSTSGNQPIGEKRSANPNAAASSTGNQTPQSQAIPPKKPNQVSPQMPYAPAHGATRGISGVCSFFCFFITLVVVFIVARSAGRGRRG